MIIFLKKRSTNRDTWWLTHPNLENRKRVLCLSISLLHLSLVFIANPIILTLNLYVFTSLHSYESTEKEPLLFFVIELTSQFYLSIFRLYKNAITQCLTKSLKKDWLYEDGIIEMHFMQSGFQLQRAGRMNEGYRGKSSSGGTEVTERIIQWQRLHQRPWWLLHVWRV